MKHIISIILSVCFLLTLSSCKKGDDSSSSSESTSSQSQSDSGSQASSSSTSQSVSQSDSQSSSMTESTDSSQWPTSFINITASDGVNALVEVIAPADWKFDKYSCFNQNEKKVMEVMFAEKITDTANPYNIPNVEQFSYVDDEPSNGFGFIKSQEVILPTTKAMFYLHKALPQNSIDPIYPHIYLLQKGDYIIGITFTTEDEKCEYLHSTYDEILDKAKIFM